MENDKTVKKNLWPIANSLFATLVMLSINTSLTVFFGTLNWARSFVVFQSTLRVARSIGTTRMANSRTVEPSLRLSLQQSATSLQECPRSDRQVMPPHCSTLCIYLHDGCFKMPSTLFQLKSIPNPCGTLEQSTSWHHFHLAHLSRCLRLTYSVTRLCTLDTLVISVQCK